MVNFGFPGKYLISESDSLFPFGEVSISRDWHMNHPAPYSPIHFPTGGGRIFRVHPVVVPCPDPSLGLVEVTVAGRLQWCGWRRWSGVWRIERISSDVLTIGKALFSNPSLGLLRQDFLAERGEIRPAGREESLQSTIFVRKKRRTSFLVCHFRIIRVLLEA